MRVSVIGAGAIGGWLSTGLVNAGAKISILARGASFDALERDGLCLSDGETEVCHPVHVTKDAADLQGADILLLGLKAHDLSAMAPKIEAALGPDTIIVPAINGVPWWFFETFGGPAQGCTLDAIDPGGVLARLMPASRVVGSVVHAASYVSAPGKIRLVKANKVWLGDAGGGAHAQTVADLMRTGGIPAEVTETLHWNVWSKLWGNSNMNPLSALTRADLSELLNDPYVRALGRQMMIEMSEIGALIGLSGFEDPNVRIAQTRALGPIRTSMLQDVEAGRPLELDPILGVLVELARHLGHPTPSLDAVYGITRLLDKNLRA